MAGAPAGRRHRRLPGGGVAQGGAAAAQRAFSEGRARKTYWAVVAGGPAGEAGSMDANLAKRTARDGWRMVVDKAGQAAITDWRVMGRGPGCTWLELSPRTGRTHQIRVHCAHAGMPIIGDTLYGSAAAGGLHLLARAIELPLETVFAGNGAAALGHAAGP